MMDSCQRAKLKEENVVNMIFLKSKKEIELLSESCQIVADTLNMLEKKIKPGIKISHLDAIAENYILSRNAKPAFKGYMGFPSTLCVSVDDEVVHGIPSDRILNSGQIVSIDCGALKNGFYGDHAKTFFVGHVDSEVKKLVNVTKESLEIGIAQAKVGNYISDIGHAIQTHAEINGFSVVRDLVGHGIGKNLHEEPQVPNFGLPKQGHKIKEGMCLAIEPMVNLGAKEIKTDNDGWTIRTVDGNFSAHFEHTIAVTSDGPLVLSKGKD